MNTKLTMKEKAIDDLLEEKKNMAVQLKLL